MQMGGEKEVYLYGSIQRGIPGISSNKSSPLSWLRFFVQASCVKLLQNSPDFSFSKKEPELYS
jgi:hypothetical protein